jgi:osmotically-inducible protein OsmY
MEQSGAVLPPSPASGPASPAAQTSEDRPVAVRVERAFRATGYLPLRAVEVAVQGRVVVLRGRVPSYYLKQIASAVARAAGATELRNDLDVVRPA